MGRRIITLEIDEAKFANWGRDWLIGGEPPNFFGWVAGENTLPFHELSLCGIKVVRDERRRSHVVREWAAMAVGEKLVVASLDDVPKDEFRRLQKQASAGANMASKRHAPKRFSSHTDNGQVIVERVA